MTVLAPSTAQRIEFFFANPSAYNHYGIRYPNLKEIVSLKVAEIVNKIIAKRELEFSDWDFEVPNDFSTRIFWVEHELRARGFDFEKAERSENPGAEQDDVKFCKITLKIGLF